MNEMHSGFIASTTTTCLFYPIDTLKMRLQHSSTLHRFVASDIFKNNL